MIVRWSRSTKMPTLNSYYISKFSERVLDICKKNKPFTAYNAKTQEYEITESLYRDIVKVEPETSYTADANVFTTFYRQHNEPFGYQLDAVDFAKKTNNIFLNFPQGMGKTLTTLKIIQERKPRRTLVVCGQGNLQEEWIKDINKHNLQYLNARIIGNDSGATSAKRIKWLRETDTDGIDLINIESLRNATVTAELNSIGYDCIVVDEVQSAKGWKSQQTTGLHELAKTPGQVRIALSGTPVLNNPLEFFSLLKFLGVLKDTARTTFEKYYGVWTFDYWGHYVCSGYRNMEDLAELLLPVLCIADKKELGLPTKHRKKIDLKWDRPKKVQDLINAYNMTTAQLKRAGYSTKPAIRAELQYEVSTARPKIDYIINQTERCLVFSRFTTVLEVYKEELEKAGKSVLYYTGEMSMKERLDILERWRNGEGQILLLSLMAARYGLNLTEAKKTIFIEPPQSIAIMEQAEDRTHRIGQDSEVFSEVLSVGMMDDSTLEMIEEKQNSIEILKDLLKTEKNLRTI